MFFLGLGVTIVGAAAQSAGISASQVGILVTIQNIGFLVSVALAGGLADRYSKTRVLALGSVILALGFGGFYLRDAFRLNALFIFLIGLGMGTYEGVTDALLIVLQPNRKSFYVNVNHFFVTLGSLIITLYLIFLQLSWRLSMTQAAVAVGVLALLFFRSEVREEKVGEKDHHVKDQVRPATSPVLLLLLVAMVCAVGLELGTISLLTTYLVELRGFNSVTAMVGLLLFIGGIGIGRTALATLISDRSVERWVLGFFLLALLAMTLLFLTSSRVALFILTPLAGLTVSVLLPSIIVLAGKWFPHQAGTAIGLVKLGIPMGGIFLPFLLAVTTRALNLQRAVLLFPLAALLGAASVLYFVVPHRLTRPRFAARIRR